MKPWQILMRLIGRAEPILSSIAPLDERQAKNWGYQLRVEPNSNEKLPTPAEFVPTLEDHLAFMFPGIDNRDNGLEISLGENIRVFHPVVEKKVIHVWIGVPTAERRKGDTYKVDNNAKPHWTDGKGTQWILEQSILDIQNEAQRIMPQITEKELAFAFENDPLHPGRTVVDFTNGAAINKDFNQTWKDAKRLEIATGRAQEIIRKHDNEYWQRRYFDLFQVKAIDKLELTHITVSLPYTIFAVHYDSTQQGGKIWTPKPDPFCFEVKFTEEEFEEAPRIYDFFQHAAEDIINVVGDHIKEIRGLTPKMILASFEQGSSTALIETVKKQDTIEEIIASLPGRTHAARRLLHAHLEMEFGQDRPLPPTWTQVPTIMPLATSVAPANVGNGNSGLHK